MATIDRTSTRSDDAVMRERLRVADVLARAHALRQRDPRGARELALAGIELAQRIDDRSALGEALVLAGSICLGMTLYDEAREMSERAIAVYEQAGDHLGIANATSGLAAVDFRLGAYGSAQKKYEASLRVYAAAGDRAAIADAMFSLGNCYRYEGRRPEALQQYAAALEFFEELGDEASVARMAMSSGIVYGELGDFVRALELFQRALRVHELHGNLASVARTSTNIGNVYRSLGEFDQALERYRTARRLHEQLGNRVGVSRAAMNIGRIYCERGEFAAALDEYRPILAEMQEVGERPGVAAITCAMADAYFASGQYDAALVKYQAALDLFEAIGDRSGVAEMNAYIGRFYADAICTRRDVAVAEQHLLRAVSLMSELGLKAPLLEAHRLLAAMYREQSRWQEAYRHLSHSHELETELHSTEAHLKVLRMEHMKQISEIEKERAVELAVEQTRRAADAHRAQLLEELLDRQRSELASHAMNLARQTELLGKVRDDLGAILRSGGDVHAIVRRVKESIKSLPSSAVDWSTFDARFRETYPGFEARLLMRYPEMTGMEMKVCALLKLKLTSANMAKVLSLSERSIEGHRLRIRRKMGLGRTDDIYEALVGI